jgi:hypothetical protein
MSHLVFRLFDPPDLLRRHSWERDTHARDDHGKRTLRSRAPMDRWGHRLIQHPKDALQEELPKLASPQGRLSLCPSKHFFREINRCFHDSKLAV